jgi:hypothetical protein
MNQVNMWTMRFADPAKAVVKLLVLKIEIAHQEQDKAALLLATNGQRAVLARMHE